MLFNTMPKTACLKATSRFESKARRTAPPKVERWPSLGRHDSNLKGDCMTVAKILPAALLCLSLYVLVPGTKVTAVAVVVVLVVAIVVVVVVSW